jgi:hypothetical protein
MATSNAVRVNETQFEQRRARGLLVVAGTLAAALTAAPALGGKSFADWLTSIFGLTSPAWQLLCGVASMCSIAATVATQLLKSHNIEDRINRVQGARAKIQMLEVGIESGLMTPAEAESQGLGYWRRRYETGVCSGETLPAATTTGDRGPA